MTTFWINIESPLQGVCGTLLMRWKIHFGSSGKIFGSLFSILLYARLFLRWDQTPLATDRVWLYVLGLKVLTHNVFKLSLSFLGRDLVADYITWEERLWVLSWPRYWFATRLVGARMFVSALVRALNPNLIIFIKQGFLTAVSCVRYAVYSWLFHYGFSFSCVFHATIFLRSV